MGSPPNQVTYKVPGLLFHLPHGVFVNQVAGFIVHIGLVFFLEAVVTAEVAVHGRGDRQRHGMFGFMQFGTPAKITDLIGVGVEKKPAGTQALQRGSQARIADALGIERLPGKEITFDPLEDRARKHRESGAESVEQQHFPFIGKRVIIAGGTTQTGHG